MRLSKFLKGTITIGELEGMPNRYIQAFYREYVLNMEKNKNNDGNQSSGSVEDIEDEIEELMGG